MGKKLKIISGAQTGVDRAVLDAALESNVSCGGWCLSGRRAEDGVIPARYPVEELEGALTDSAPERMCIGTHPSLYRDAER